MDGKTQSVPVFTLGDTVEGKYDFEALSPDDLSFKKREPLTITKGTTDAMWYLASNKAGKHGLVPTNFLVKVAPLESEVWYHGKISRQQTEDLLRGVAQGTFLVRDSSSYNGDYTMCIAYQDKVEHYHVIRRSSKVTVDEVAFFRTLALLVQYYKSSADGGLCCRLARPVQQKPTSYKPRSLTMTRDQVSRLSKTGLTVDRKEIVVLEAIGHGDFGEVRKGRFKGMDVAVKSLLDNTAAMDFLEEANIMGTLHHPHLVRLMGVVVDEPVCILTEFMARGSLINWLRTRGRSITASEQIKFAIDTCSGMGYLEKQGVVHRDLAARNVLLAQDGTAKVSDFGLAKYEFTDQDKSKFPIKWTAPEAIRLKKFTSKSDVWSFGVMLWEIYSYGRIPYPRIPMKNVVRCIEEGYRMPNPHEACTDSVYAVMTEAWNIDPNLRPTFAALMVMLSSL